jgi:GNAT superfamily N-acetyltransferase
MKIELKQLSECPESLTTVGDWIYHEWWFRAHKSPEAVYNFLRTHTAKDLVPFTVVAFVNGQPVGSCSVIENDCVHRPQYAPWVAAVFVKPELRNRGIASAILQEAATIAARSGIEGLYIDCHMKTGRFYDKNGWAIHEREVGDKDSVVMLRRIKPGR